MKFLGKKIEKWESEEFLKADDWQIDYLLKYYKKLFQLFKKINCFEDTLFCFFQAVFISNWWGGFDKVFWHGKINENKVVLCVRKRDDNRITFISSKSFLSHKKDEEYFCNDINNFFIKINNFSNNCINFCFYFENKEIRVENIKYAFLNKSKITLININDFVRILDSDKEKIKIMVMGKTINDVSQRNKIISYVENEFIRSFLELRNDIEKISAVFIREKEVRKNKQKEKNQKINDFIDKL